MRFGIALDIVSIVVALAGLIAAWFDLDKYRAHPLTYKLAKRPVMLWLIILLAAMNILIGDTR